MIPMFVVFEGVDGAGKSEVSKIVAEKLGAIHLESPTVNTPFLTQHHCRIIKPPVCTQQVSYH